MELFLKCISLAILGVCIYPIITQKEKSFTVPFLLLICGFGLVAAVRYLQPVIELLSKLQTQSSISPGVFTVLLKVTGVGLISEIAILITADAGNASLGRSIALMASAAVLWMSIPLIEDLLDLITNIIDLQ
jgi:stage III sporulation protein AD